MQPPSHVEGLPRRSFHRIGAVLRGLIHKEQRVPQPIESGAALVQKSRSNPDVRALSRSKRRYADRPGVQFVETLKGLAHETRIAGLHARFCHWLLELR